MVLTDKLRRSLTLAVAAMLFLASLVPLLSRQHASAYTYNQLGSRQVKMSESGGGVTAVKYRVRFKVASTTNIKSVVVTFCSNSPIIGNPVCDLPAGFSVAGATVNGYSTSAPDTNPDNDMPGGNSLATADLSAWSGTPTILNQDTLTSSPNTVVISDSTGTGVLTAGTEIIFTINGVANPTANNTSFYSRIYTFDSTTGGTGYTLANPDAGVGNPSTDAGGIALSTAAQITITSKVQEKLTFCVYTAASFTTGTDNTCVGKPTTPASVNLGDTNGVLDSAGPFVDKTAYYSITTNAAGNALVRVKGDTLKSGAHSIAAIGATPALTNNPVGGAEQFGFCTYQNDGSGLAIADGSTIGLRDYTGSGTGGAGCSATTQTSGTASTGGTGAASFTFDTNNTDGTLSPYGDVIAKKSTGGYSTGNLAFIGNISDVTSPGIYTTTLSFIATGTY